MVGITGGSKGKESQIEVLGDVRSTQEKEIIIIDQAFVV